MKKLLTLFLFLFVCLLAQADTITFSMINVSGNPDNTPIWVNPVSSFVNANGTYNTRGFPFWIYPTNGFVSTNLPAGFYVASNAVMGTTLVPNQGGTWFGFVFNVLSNGNNSTYPFTTFPQSGYNFYRPNSQTVVITNPASGGTITQGVGTNQSYVVLTSGNTVFSGTNYDVQYAASNALAVATNTFDALGAAQKATNVLGVSSQFSAFVNTNQFDPSNAAKNATNILGTAAYQNIGAFDAAGAALASTNGLGIPSTLSAFVNTNRFDTNGSGSQAYAGSSNSIFSATNNIGIPSTLSAFVSTNRFDTNGAGSQAFNAASNMVVNATNGAVTNPNIITNTQALVSFGSVNLPGWIDVTNTSGDYFKSNTLTAQTFFIKHWASGGSAQFGSTNGNFLSSNITAIAAINAGGSISGGQVSGTSLVSSGNLTVDGNALLEGIVTTTHNTLDDGSGNIVASENITWQDGQLNGSGVLLSGGSFQGSGAGLTAASVPIASVANLTASQNNLTNLISSSSNTVAFLTVASTNGIGIPSGLSAFTLTNRFDTNNAGAQSFASGSNFVMATSNQLYTFTVASTNGMGIPSALSAFAPTNRFDTNNAGNQAFVSSSNFTMTVSNQVAQLVSGGGTPNAFITNNSGAFPSVAAPNAALVISNLSVITNLYVGGILIVSNIASSTQAGFYGTNINVQLNPAKSSSVGNLTISAYNSTYVGSESFTIGNVELPGNLETNGNQYSVTMGSDLDNEFGSVFLYNTSGNLAKSTANNQFILYPGGGAMIDTNASGGYALNVAGTIGSYSNVDNVNIFQQQTMAGGNPYQTLSTALLGVTNFSGNLAGANGSYLQISSTLWYDTNSPNIGFVATISTNGASCLIQSNGVTVATAGASINGTYTISAPGSGNAPGVYIGSQIQETGVYHIGQGVFQSLRATNFSDSTATLGPFSLFNALTNGSGFVTPNIEIVSPSGNNSTGTRGTASAYANLWAAGQAAQAGDIIYVLNGTYQEGSNNIGQAVKNLSIVGFGSPIIVYTNYSSSVTPLSIYVQPNDNLFIQNITFSTPVSNHLSAFIGNNGNVAGTATNCTFVGVSSRTADSDGFYWGGTNLFTGTFINCLIHYYWDGWATASTVNTNDTFTLYNCEFHCDELNGINPTTISGMNMTAGATAGGCNTYLNNVSIFLAKTNTGSAIGLRIGGASVYLNHVNFNDLVSHGLGSPNFADIAYSLQYANGGLGGIVNSETTNSLVIYNNNTTPGFPNNLAGNSLYGTLNVPMNISQSPADGSAQIFGNWLFQDIGTNGTMLLTNVNNLVAANGGSSVQFQPDDGSSAAPVEGTIRLTDMAISSYKFMIPSNTYSLSTYTSLLSHADFIKSDMIISSNGQALMDIHMSNGVAYPNYMTYPGGGILP